MEGLMWVLMGKAGEFFASEMNKYPQLRYDDIVNKLACRFGRNDIPENLMAQFMTETQEPNESLEDWADRIGELGARAYPEFPIWKITSLSVTRFCQGCTDREAGYRVISGNQRPNSLENVVAAIKWQQLNYKAIFGSNKGQMVPSVSTSSDEHVVQAVTKMSQKFRSPSPSKDLDRINILEEKIKIVERKVDNMSNMFERKMDTIISMLSKVTRTPPGQTYGQRSSPRERSPTSPKRNRESDTFFQCGGVGHFMKECPSRKRQLSKSVSFCEKEYEVETVLNESGSDKEP